MTSSAKNPSSEAPKKGDKKSEASVTKPEISTKTTVPALHNKRDKKEGSANPIVTFAAGVPDVCGILRDYFLRSFTRS
ncbi:hypothetical protein DER46DRAFT_664212 [Fusarium sp. MPI-SDFR-AT-0072]|nr:hypothetical protein DER46DRAFT_664212 [Fusarium sp. MPI-SDFR-AT-0072]KAI7762506.1 hypothetical protein LZL87_008852 [Fusarium oxysporum]